jgi:glycyl-tRNA synthetase
MVKDVVNGEIFRADHLVEAVLESRLKGDKEARGQAAAPPAAEDDKKKKKKKVVKSTAVKMEDSVVKEYEFLLAQVGRHPHYRPTPLSPLWNLISLASCW